MAHYDAETADVTVFTQKEGLLSAIAHDLRIRVDRVSIDVADDGSSVRGTFDARSLRVVSAMRDGRDAGGLLSDRDRRQIEGHVVDDVLAAKRWPEIKFTSTSVVKRDAATWAIVGDVTLAGVSRRIETVARREGERVVAEVVLHQPDFGIKPFRAALGTLRVQADVRVRVSIPHQ